MKLEQRLKKFGAVPVTHSALCSILGEYRSPNDKIQRMIDDGLLVSIKKSLYAVSPELTGTPLSLPLVSNLLYGPSYISMDYALYHYGIIPERVIEITAMTTRRSNRYNLAIGRFSYMHSPVQFYTIGITRIENGDKSGFLIATPEKALCDKLVFTRNLNIKSPRALQELLFDDLRLDEDTLAHFDTTIIKAALTAGLKTAMLQALVQLISTMQKER